MKYSPHNYQTYATNFILEHPVSAVFLDMGLGKSVITLSAIFDLCLDSFLIRKVLVIAPLRVARDTWPAEIKKWDHLHGLSYSVAIRTEVERKAALRQRASVYIINRENVQWLIEESGIPFDFDMVVIDELSSFKSYQATFTAAGTQLGHAWASDWSKDTDNHWKECSRCHEKKDEAAHDYGSDNICDTCGYDKTVPHTHNLTLVPAKAPTCTEKGNTAYYTCDGCDKWFEDATGASEITDKTSVILAATGHSASDWKSDNTDHWKECTVVGCGVITEDSKAAHTAGEWIIDTPATATTSGSKHKECTVCGYTMTAETIPATGGGEHTHSYGSEWKYDADNHWHECSCGDKSDLTAHSFKWLVDKEATAAEKGSKHEECTVCGYKKAAVEIPATGSTTKPTDPTQTNPNTGAESPKTGDNSNMILWIALLFISGGVLTGVTVFDKRKRHSAK